MSYQIFNEASLGKFIELIKNKVKSMVDNANVASATNATNATKATQDSDGNAINTTYRKISDSYSKTEVDEKVGKSSSSIILTTDNLIANYTYTKLLNLLENGTAVYLEITKNDRPFAPLEGMKLSINMYNNDGIIWSVTNSSDRVDTLTVTALRSEDDDSIQFMYSEFLTNTFTKVSTISIAASAWNSASKTATVSVSGVTADNAVDVAPAGSSFDDYVNAGIRATAQREQELTFMCKAIPTKTISVNIKSITTEEAVFGDRNFK